MPENAARRVTRGILHPSYDRRLPIDPVVSPPYHPPIKRSVRIDGHDTSISLEPIFWNLLREAAAQESVSVNTLVAQIDADRIQSETPPGLAGALRTWLVMRLIDSDRQ